MIEEKLIKATTYIDGQIAVTFYPRGTQPYRVHVHASGSFSLYAGYQLAKGQKINAATAQQFLNQYRAEPEATQQLACGHHVSEVKSDRLFNYQKVARCGTCGAITSIKPAAVAPKFRMP